MESQKIQSFFVPSEGNSWRFIEADDDLVKEENPSWFSNGITDIYGVSGFWDHSKMNQNFKKLIDKLELSERTTEELARILYEFIGESLNLNCDSKSNKAKSNTGKGSNWLTLLQTIHDCHFRGVRVTNAALKNQVDVGEAKKSLALFKRNLKSIKRDNRKFPNKTTKTNENTIDLIKEFLLKNRFSLFKLDDLRLYLQNKLDKSLTILNSTLEDY